jgi:dipeptide/tripeptide permease
MPRGSFPPAAEGPLAVLRGCRRGIRASDRRARSARCEHRREPRHHRHRTHRRCDDRLLRRHLSSKLVTPVERNRVHAFIPLFIASAAFWSLCQQQFTEVTIYSDERLDRRLFGWVMPVSWVQSINPIVITLLAGIFTAVRTKRGPRQPSTPLKFAAGTVIMGLALGSAVSGWLTTWYLTVPETLCFGVLGGIAVVLGLALALIAKPVLRLMSGVR